MRHFYSYPARIPAAILILFSALAPMVHAAGPSDAASHDWPQWRGPNRDGASTESGWQAVWPTDGPKRLWETRVDRGYSSFAVVDGRVYTQGFRPEGPNGTETVYCLDAQTGKEVWKYSYAAGLPQSHVPVANTPTVVGGRVYTYGNAADLQCLDAATGKPLWSHNTAKEYGAASVVYGYNASPLVTSGVVIVPIFTGQGQKPMGGGSYPIPGGELLAFAADSGKLVWHNKDGASAWATATVGTIDGKATIVTYTGRTLLGINPADGTTLWKDDTVRGDGPFAVATMPVIVEGKVLVATHVHGIYCVEVTGGKVQTLWTRPFSHWFECFAVWQGCIYAPSKIAELDCVDLKTGKDLWHSTMGMPEQKSDDNGPGRKDAADNPPDRPARSGGPGGPAGPGGPGGGMAREPIGAGGALMIADGKVLMLNRDGALVCAEVSATGAKVLSVARIMRDDGGWKYHSTPTLCNGRLYCRTSSDNHGGAQVICLDVSGK
jgi:outer membrane protein assembly factor BamB